MDKLLQNQRRIFRWASFNFEGSEGIATRLFFWISTILLIASLEPEVYFIYKHLANIPLATQALCTVISCFVAIAKIILVRWYRLTIYDLFRELQHLGRQSNCVLFYVLP